MYCLERNVIDIGVNLGSLDWLVFRDFLVVLGLWGRWV